jgi:hypothetical protein
MGNPQKSWKGAPTTNLLVDTDNLATGNWGFTLFGNWPATGATANAAIAPDGTQTATRLSASGYSRFQRYAVSANQTYTFSMWVKNVNMTAPIGIQLATGLNGTLVAYGSYYTGVSLTADWARYSYTITIPASGVNQLEVGLNVNPNYSNANVFCDVWRPQLELQSFATPFVNGTRSNTQAVLDLTNNNTVTATSLTYASDGTFSFNGTTDYLSIPNTQLGNGNIAWTVSCWIKTTTAVNALGLGSVLSNISGGPVYSMMGVNSGKIVYWTYQNSAWAQKLGIGKTVNDGNWHMLTWVNYSNNTMDMYVDGLLDSNVANSTSGNNNPVDVIGRSWAGYFPGSIASLTRYNRALSAAEVQQNFNALRGRYGL